MKYLKLACFGYNIYQYNYDALKKIIIPSDDILQYNYLIKGRLKIFKDEVFLCEKNEGDFLNDDFFVNGKFHIETMTDCELIHISDDDNRNFLPEVKPFFHKKGEQLKVSENTKIFLCSGIVNVDDKNIKAPFQIFFINEKNIKFLTDCYILKVK